MLHTIDVPGPDAFALSSPTCPPASDGRPSLERRVAAGGTLRCAFEVFGSSGAVSAGHVVWRDGAAVRETRATLVEPAGGTLRCEIATDLAGLAPGDYLLELRVHDQTTDATSTSANPSRSPRTGRRRPDLSAEVRPLEPEPFARIAP